MVNNSFSRRPRLTCFFGFDSKFLCPGTYYFPTWRVIFGCLARSAFFLLRWSMFGLTPVINLSWVFLVVCGWSHFILITLDISIVL